MNYSAQACLVLASTAMVLTGCGQPSELPMAESLTPSPSTIAPSEPAPSSPPASVSDENLALLSEQGIGPAQLGMTIGDLKQELGANAEFSVQSPFIVDFDAIAVRQDGEVQYYILYLAGQQMTDSDVIQGLFTDNPKYRTDEGVGPGTPIAQAEEAYGKATLAYNTQNESREYVRFERQPASNISFGTGNANEETAGIYPSPTGEYNETQEFNENATIQSVLIICLAEGCSG